MIKFTDKEVRWGVLGVGAVCERKSAPAMQKVPNSRLVAVMRRDGEKARDYARRHQVDKWYDDADKLIADPEVNAIYIATPPNAHLELARMAAAAGKPVYVEKPMARTYAECQEMIRICEAAGVPLFVAYYRRTLPNFLKIKSLLESGVIGELRYVQVLMNQPAHPDVKSGPNDNWRINPEISGGGYFYDLGSHQLDFLDYLLGPVKSVRALARNQAGWYGVEDIVSASFEFESGVMGSGVWCFASSEASKTDMTTLVGSKGQISYPSFWDTYVDLKMDTGVSERYTFEMPENIQYFLINSIVQELLGQGTCPSTGHSAARTNWVMEEMTASMRKS
ncbi:Gfo/Idh/MocA family protein [Lunatimonas salinarum]|uniref:Gfo/Idh/MocA family protein n=1 Tax=Lunatimonas salinarum TaxID=1774590 RepID=UPI001AE03043|nr:Gfo/Idh/MocA family oxidoreductase [Lunatimonas salinarum]